MKTISFLCFFLFAVTSNASQPIQVSICTLDKTEYKYYTLDKYGYCKDKRQFCLSAGEPYQLGEASKISPKKVCGKSFISADVNEIASWKTN
jgi:hypothetical protein